MKYYYILLFAFLNLQVIAQDVQTRQPVDTAAKSNELNEVHISTRYYKRYKLDALSKTLRLNTPLIALPQNIQEIGKEVIADQGSYNMTEGVSRNVSGVIRLEISNNLGPYLFMRGGLVSTLRDGVDLTPIYRGPVPEDAAIIERVEFIKGPSMFMNNIGDPAGTFNVVTKQPEGKTAYAIDLMAGSYNFYRLAADLGGILDKKGKLQYRLNAMGMKSRSFVDYDFNDRLLIAPVLKYAFSAKTSLTASYIYQRFNYGLMSPIVMAPEGFGTLPRSFTISEPGLDTYHPVDQNAFITFNHDFNPSWSLTVKGGFMQNDNEGEYMWVTGVNKANPDILLRNPKYDLTRAVVYSEQAYVNGKVKTGEIRHNILAGADFNQKRFLADSYVAYDLNSDGSLKYYPLDVRQPVYGATVPGYTTLGGVTNGNTSQRITYVSFFALDEVSVLKERLKLTLGGRFTSAQTYNRISGLITRSSDQVFTPRIGLNYSVQHDFSVYALHDRTFTPQAGSVLTTEGTSDGMAVKPKKGLLYEAGLKKDWLKGKWNTTLSAYFIKRSGVISADPNNSAYFIQIGESTAKGVDFDLKGRIFKGMNAVINYAWNDSQITSDVDQTLIGQRTPLFVKHIQNTWLTYDLPFRKMSGFGISAGYQYQAGRSGRYATATPYAVPDFFRLDGGLRWSGKKMSINLVVNNLLNKSLLGTPWLRNGLYYWIPQAGTNARLSMGYKF